MSVCGLKQRQWLPFRSTNSGGVCLNVLVCPVWTEAECTFGTSVWPFHHPLIYPCKHTQRHHSVFFMYVKWPFLWPQGCTPMSAKRNYAHVCEQYL